MPRKSKSITWLENHPPVRFDLSKPAPVLNTSLDIRPSFGPMLHELMHAYDKDMQTTVADLLEFCATTVSYEDVEKFFQLRA